MNIKKLFEPQLINSLKIRNRFVVPAMVTNYGNCDGTITETLIHYHCARAKGGFGLNITENFAVHPMGRGFARALGLWSDYFVDGCEQINKAVHQEGGRIFAQIYHAGAQTRYETIGRQPVAPSAILHAWNRVLPRELTREEIYEIVECFGKAARRARNAGFDGVEVHGAHGYLVAQFMSGLTNKRTDEYGGDVLGRLRFPLDILKAIRSEVGQEFPVIIRLAGDERVPGGRDLEETGIMAPYLEEAGYDGLHITTATTYNLPYVVPCFYTPKALNVSYAEVIKKIVSIPIISTGRINDPLLAEKILRENRADFIGMGRASIADPELPNKVMAGNMDEIKPCIGCLQGCMGRLHAGKPISCVANPTVGREKEMEIRKGQKTRKILVIGGGPAGLEAATAASLCGHDVVLHEKTDRLGGQLNIAAVPPFKHEFAHLIKSMVRHAEKAGVKIIKNMQVNLNSVNGYDTVILATGGVPKIPKIPGIESKNVFTAWEILRGDVTTGENVLIIGGGMVGCETADFLASQGKKVMIVEALEEIATDLIDRIKYFLLPRLEENKVQIKTSAFVKGILPDGVLIQTGENMQELHGYSSIVLAMGTLAENRLAQEISKKYPNMNIVSIGDAKEPRNLLDAIAEGAELGRTS